MDWRRLGQAMGRLEVFWCLLFGVLASLVHGQDASWDLRNYHLYNAWAVLHGRLWLDLAPAGLQTYFNPLLDLPYYLLGTGWLAHRPMILAGLQGLWLGGVVWVLLNIARRLARLRGRTLGAPDVFAVLIGATGTMAISQAGLSSNEIPLAFLVLLSVYLLLPVCGAFAGEWKCRVVLAGLACGLAAGLKPTAIVYAPALATALWLAGGRRGVAWRATMVFGGMALTGFLVAYGWWGWRLFHLTGNPVFPLFNQVFHSSWVPLVSDTDARFLPRSIGQWLFYPFYWVHKNHGLVTEVNFADARYALAMLAVLALALMGALRSRQPHREGRRVVRFVVVFVAVAYVCWLVLFSILRYAVPIEALTGLLILVAVQIMERHPPRAGGRPPHWQTVIMVTLFVLLAGFARYPRWGHVPFAARAFDISPPELPRESLVLVVGQPLAYVIPFIDGAASDRFVGLTWFNWQARHDRLGELTRQRLHNHSGPVYALVKGVPKKSLGTVRRWLPDAGFDLPCQMVRGTLAVRDKRPRLHLCRVLPDKAGSG